MTLKTIHDLPNIAQFPPEYDSDPGTFLARMYEQFGPIFKGTRYQQEWVYMIGPEANRFVLSGNRLKFSHHQGWGMALGVVAMLGNGLLTMDGTEHDQHRRMMNPAFTIAYMDRYLPLMNRIVHDRTAEWNATGTVDVYEAARKITFDVAAEALMGLRVGPEVDEFRVAFYELMYLGDGVTSYEEYLSKQAVLRLRLAKMLLPKIKERRAQPTDDVLGMMIAARDENGQALTDEQIVAHSNILLVAGHETSTTLSAFLLHQLVENPAYLARVRTEQDAILDRDDDPTLDDIKRMKVLDNALSEAERLYPPVAFGPRGAAEDFEFNGYLIPAGTLVGYQIAGSHRLRSIFADPEKFDPDRFAAPREEDKKSPYALVGFGGGPRICIGINFAQVEMKAMVSYIVRHFDLTVVPNQSIKMIYNGTGSPQSGIKMHIQARKN